MMIKDSLKEKIEENLLIRVKKADISGDIEALRQIVEHLTYRYGYKEKDIVSFMYKAIPNEGRINDILWDIS
tara:strand:- start:332 stop:547 length:216 start_codon:yes stop_codon:yes gene_type:complete